MENETLPEQIHMSQQRLLTFKFCECGCLRHIAKGLKDFYSIFRSDKEFTLITKHNYLGPYPSKEEAETAAEAIEVKMRQIKMEA